MFGTSVFHVRSRSPQGGSIRAEACNPYLECQPRGRRQAQPRPVWSRDDGSKVRLAARDGSVLHELKKARD